MSEWLQLRDRQCEFARVCSFRAMECRYLSAEGGDGCGLARFLVALGGGGFAAAKMSADDRGSMDMGRLQEVYSGESLGLVKFFCSAKGKSVGTTRYRDLNSDTPACLSTGYTFIDRSDIGLLT